MYNKELAILTVSYLSTITHRNIAKRAYKSMPNDIYRLNVVNRNAVNFPVSSHNNQVIKNDENCLARAYNKGLRELFKKYKYVLISNLDVIFDRKLVPIMLDEIKKDKSPGIVSATYKQVFGSPLIAEEEKRPIEHGDGSFSCFIITKECFEKVGLFDEIFRPAYFEDNDYLERCWQEGFKPIRLNHAIFFHFVQGTVKNDRKVAKEYPKFMQRNLEYYIEKYGKPPTHLPEDIKFI